MKTALRLIAVLTLGVIMLSCKDRAAEKRIAELEDRLKKLEGSGATPAAATPSPAATTASAGDAKPEGPLPQLQFERVEHDFGTIKEGEKVSYTYKFTNNGQAPLIIQSAQPSCGCTAPDWSREPIPVGGTGFVKAEFDSKGKPGIQNKTITVTANTWPKQMTLRFKAMVTPASDGSNGPVK